MSTMAVRPIGPEAARAPLVAMAGALLAAALLLLSVGAPSLTTTEPEPAPTPTTVPTPGREPPPVPTARHVAPRLAPSP